nr:hypothetical protein [Limnoglobus roseus]
MTPTLLIRDPTAGERVALRRGLKSADGFTARRCQVLLASAGGSGPAAIGLSAQAVRNAIRASHADGLACLGRQPPVARAPALIWDRKYDDGLKDLVHRRPREFGRPTSLWTLALAAGVCHAKGRTTRRPTAEGVRGVLARPGIGRKRAEHWITSPDPEYAKKKRRGPGDRGGRSEPRLGGRVPGRVLVDPVGPARPVHLGDRRPAPAREQRPRPQGHDLPNGKWRVSSRMFGSCVRSNSSGVRYSRAEWRRTRL